LTSAILRPASFDSNIRKSARREAMRMFESDRKAPANPLRMQ
jgi:hypothetical protein